MKTENYIKLIFEEGSVILRKVKNYWREDKNQVVLVIFEDNSKVILDLIYLQSSMGELKHIKDNVHDIKETTLMDISQCDVD